MRRYGREQVDVGYDCLFVCYSSFVCKLGKISEKSLSHALGIEFLPI